MQLTFTQIIILHSVNGYNIEKQERRENLWK